MSCDPELTNRMERPNQPPKPECCRQPGQASSPTKGNEAERTAGSVHKDTHGPQTGVASGLSDSAPKHSTADGEAVASSEPNTGKSEEGEDQLGLPGSKSVAHA